MNLQVKITFYEYGKKFYLFDPEKKSRSPLNSITLSNPFTL